MAKKIRLGGRSNPTQLEAFGERKTIAEWTRDPRCSVTIKCLTHRVKKGWSHEEAVSLPTFAYPGKEAFGELKTYADWRRDPRCVVSKATLMYRLSEGWSLETALTTPMKASGKRTTPSKPHRKGVLPAGDAPVLEAFGSKKSLREWAIDPRCQATYRRIRQRLVSGWSLEDAIAVPKARNLREGTATIKDVAVPEVDRSADPVRLSQTLTAFGVVKSLEQWLEDPRCAVSEPTLLDRLGRGYPLEEAMSVKFLAKGMGPLPMLKAFGEAKTVMQWSEDERCVISYDALRLRLKQGMDVETAMTKPRKLLAAKDRSIEAFGEFKTVGEWSKDDRCVVNFEALRARVRGGMPMEMALTSGKLPHPTSFKPVSITAFGETKTLAQWTKDPRCRVSLAALQQRLSKSKLLPEEALTFPPRKHFK